MLKMIVAIDVNRGIGYQNELLFNLKKDMAFFKRKTLNGIVVMGTNTFKSLKREKGLPNRTNIVVTRSPEEFEGTGIYATKDIDSILALSEHHDVFVIGGASIYELFLPYAEELFITQVTSAGERVDTYFPEFHEDFRLRRVECALEESGFYYLIEKWERK